jgi:phospholipid/cholesterol/gamma-HCH transport system substrate-binding protein
VRDSAADSRARDVRVGAFVLAALSIAVAGALWITGSGVLRERRTSYEVTLTDSAGLSAGDHVRIAGVTVGRIRGVRLRPGEEHPVRLEVAIRDAVPIRTGSTARVATTGLLGTPHLEIDPGDERAPRLPAGGEIPGGASAGIDAALARLDDLAAQASVALAQTVELVERVSASVEPLVARVELFLSDENASELAAILVSARTNLDEAGPRLQQTLISLERGSVELERTLARTPELQERIARLVDEVDLALGPEGQRLGAVLDSAEAALVSAQETISAMGSQRELEATVRDLRDAVANLKSFSQTIEERPYSLVRMKLPRDRKPGQGVAGRR